MINGTSYDDLRGDIEHLNELVDARMSELSDANAENARLNGELDEANATIQSLREVLSDIQYAAKEGLK